MVWISIYSSLPLFVSSILFIFLNIKLFMGGLPLKEKVLKSIVVFLTSFFCCYLSAALICDFVLGKMPVYSNTRIIIEYVILLLMIFLFASLYHIYVAKRIEEPYPIEYTLFIYYQFVNAGFTSEVLGDSEISKIILNIALFIFWYTLFKDDLEFVKKNSDVSERYVFIILQNIMWVLIFAINTCLYLYGDNHEVNEVFVLWIQWITLGLYITNFVLVKAMLHSMRVRRENEIIRSTDEVTGLMNGAYFKLMVNSIVNGELKEDFAICYYNIGEFTSYNEKYGFQKGNELLKQIGSILNKVHSRYAVVSRLSDDHFGVCAPKEGIDKQAKLIHGLVKGVHMGAGIEINCGIYCIKAEDTEPSLCLDKAKFACDTLKDNASSVIRYYDTELDNAIKRERYIVDNIDKAIAYGHIEVYYQPIISAQTGEIINYEALARWNDPIYGMISPADFVETLEQHYKIHKLDQHVIRRVGQDLKRLSKDGYDEVPVSVNISRRDLQMMDAIAYVDSVVENCGITKDMFIIEITETSIADDVEFMLAEMNRFRENGYKVWLDDFGSGYSSLNILKDFEFDGIKLDMLFLRTFNDRSKRIVNSLINMSKKLEICVLAEGVEEKEQLDFLKDIGCDKAQGYLISKPEPLPNILKRFYDKE
ncbi:MAG: bifunctional diguanylate cyclase/phosphodiesterase [Eubacterium sp.]|nr:bifunctional diguanylate cyclase/phosphodiesterase [Eubacterium sp.]